MKQEKLVRQNHDSQRYHSKQISTSMSSVCSSTSKSATSKWKLNPIFQLCITTTIVVLAMANASCIGTSNPPQDSASEDAIDNTSRDTTSSKEPNSKDTFQEPTHPDNTPEENDTHEKDRALQDEATEEKKATLKPEEVAEQQPIDAEALNVAEGTTSKIEITVDKLMSLDAPIDMTAAPGDDLLWIAERSGKVLRVALSEDSGEVVDVLLDISDETSTESERGLLGIAASENWLYVSFTDIKGDSRVDAFKRQGTRLGTERRTLLTLEQPYSNHNGGDLALDKDSHLYIGFGDGGSGGDPHSHSQNPNTWLGSMLRITPTPHADKPYLIPEDNPFTSDNSQESDNIQEGSPEVFLLGLRNPWRFSFDTTTNDLWIADVGQDRYEEVTVLRSKAGNVAGANLGWNLKEGTHIYSPDASDTPHAHSKSLENLVDPIWEYSHADGCSVTGGFVYRGSAIPELYGSYIFGDYCTSRLWSLANAASDEAASGKMQFVDLDVDVPGGMLSSFGQDRYGELYTMSLSGDLARIEPK